MSNQRNNQESVQTANPFFTAGAYPHFNLDRLECYLALYLDQPNGQRLDTKKISFLNIDFAEVKKEFESYLETVLPDEAEVIRLYSSQLQAAEKNVHMWKALETYYAQERVVREISKAISEEAAKAKETYWEENGRETSIQNVKTAEKNKEMSVKKIDADIAKMEEQLRALKAERDRIKNEADIEIAALKSTRTSVYNAGEAVENAALPKLRVKFGLADAEAKAEDLKQAYLELAK